MRTFSRTSQFKKDVKRAGKRGENLSKLRAVMDLLIEGGQLPPELKDHLLRGNFAGSRDCHIEPDWVLIYMLMEKDNQSALNAPARTATFSAELHFRLQANEGVDGQTARDVCHRAQKLRLVVA